MTGIRKKNKRLSSVSVSVHPDSGRQFRRDRVQSEIRVFEVDGQRHGDARDYPVKLLRSVRNHERSIIIAIACNELHREATRSTRGAAWRNMLRGDGENTSGAERREKEKKRRRELASKADSRIAYAYALTHVNVYANAPHGATDGRQSVRAPRRKRAEKTEPSCEPEGKDLRAKRRWKKSRRRNRGVGTSDSNYLELQADDRTIPRAVLRRTYFR